MDEINELKQQAAYRACDFIEDGMILGLGSGSTISYVFERLQEKMRQGMHIQAICSSIQTEAAARQHQIPILAKTANIVLDLNIDGVDQIDPTGNVIKGGGAALTREKMLAQWATRTIWIMDERKPVDCLDPYTLPIEILPFNHEHLISCLQEKGYQSTLRLNKKANLITDNGGYILDVKIGQGRTMKQAHNELKQIAGIVETGYFERRPSSSIIAGRNGISIINYD